MTVSPGFGGQTFKGYVLEKVRELAKHEKRGHSFLIEGGVGPQHVDECLGLG